MDQPRAEFMPMQPALEIDERSFDFEDNRIVSDEA